VTSHNVILLASGDIERRTSMGIFPLHIYLPVYPTNYAIEYPGNELPGYDSPKVHVSPKRVCSVRHAQPLTRDERASVHTTCKRIASENDPR